MRKNYGCWLALLVLLLATEGYGGVLTHNDDELLIDSQGASSTLSENHTSIVEYDVIIPSTVQYEAPLKIPLMECNPMGHPNYNLGYGAAGFGAPLLKKPRHLGIQYMLMGIEGKLNKYELSFLKNTVETEYNNHWSEDILHKNLLEYRLDHAEDQGLILQLHNNLTFGHRNLPIAKLKHLIKGNVAQIKAMIQKGFTSVPVSYNLSGIVPLINELSLFVKGFNTRLNALHMQPLRDKKKRFKNIKNLIGFLLTRTLQSKINSVLEQSDVVPVAHSDAKAVLTLELLVNGLFLEADALLSVILSYGDLADMSLEQNNLDEVNNYKRLQKLAFEKFKLYLGSSAKKGIIKKAAKVIADVKKSSFREFSNLLAQRLEEIKRLEYIIEDYINNYIELPEPGFIMGELDFSPSFVELPYGSWESGKNLSYAVQFRTNNATSLIGKWSSPVTVLEKANPIVQLPTATRGISRLLYRRFNNELPELVGIIEDSEQAVFRDIERDFLNSAAHPDDDIAAKEIESLINDGVNVNVSLTNNINALHLAAGRGNLKAMETLIKNGADIHAKTTDDREPLHYAALSGGKECLEYLIEKGAHINVITKSLGFSPLHIAVSNGHISATELLISKEASINNKDSCGLTPLHLSVSRNVNIMNVLLEKDSLDSNSEDADGMTPLHYAASGNDVVFVQKIVQRLDLNVNAMNLYDITPLHISSQVGNIENIAMFIHLGAIASSTDIKGSTPLHYAAFHKQKRSAIILTALDFSLKPLRNSENQTALDLAVENGDDDIVTLLEANQDKMVEITKLEMSKDVIVLDPDWEDWENSTTCSGREVGKMALGVEKTCRNIDDVNSYVNLVLGMVPLTPYHEDSEEALQRVFEHYDGDLILAKNHAKIWKHGKSILGGIRRTVLFARKFEAEFNWKYEKNEQRMLDLENSKDEFIFINKTKADIKRLEKEMEPLLMFLKTSKEEAILTYFRNSIDEKQAEIQALNLALEKNVTIVKKLEEYVVFLRYVRTDSSEIKKLSAQTMAKAEMFERHLRQDDTAFKRHRRIATNSLNSIEDSKSEGNDKIQEYMLKRERLQKEIEESKQNLTDLWIRNNELDREYDTVKKSLEAAASKSWTWKIVGAVLTPLLIGIPLLIHASNEETRLLKQLDEHKFSANQARNILLKQIDARYVEMDRLSMDLINSGELSVNMSKKMEYYSAINHDLDYLSTQIDLLVEAIKKAIVGVEIIGDVFGGVTEKLDEIIVKATRAETNAELLDAYNFAYENLSLLQCNWKDIYIRVNNIDVCTRKFKLSTTDT